MPVTLPQMLQGATPQELATLLQQARGGVLTAAQAEAARRSGDGVSAPEAPQARYAPMPGGSGMSALPVREVGPAPTVRPLQSAQGPMGYARAGNEMVLPQQAAQSVQDARLPSQPPMGAIGGDSLLAPPYRPRGGLLGAPEPQQEAGGIMGTGLNPLTAIGLALSGIGDLSSGGQSNSLGNALQSLALMQEMRRKQAMSPDDYLKTINNQLVDIRTGEVVGDYRDPSAQKRDLFTVKEGDEEVTYYGDKNDPTTWSRFSTAPRYKPPSTTVNIEGDKVESEFSKTFGRTMGEQAANIYAESDRAVNQLSRMDRLEALADQWEQSGGSLGPLATTQENAAAWAQAVGLDPASLGLPEDAGPAQAIRALSNEMALGKIGGEDGMPANNFSDADRRFIQSTVPQITDTPEGLRLKIEVTRRGAERAREKELMWAEAEAQGKTYREFRREWNDYVQNNPIFSEDEMGALERAAKADKGAPDSGRQRIRIDAEGNIIQ